MIKHDLDDGWSTFPGVQVVVHEPHEGCSWHWCKPPYCWANAYAGKCMEDGTGRLGLCPYHAAALLPERPGVV